MTIGRLKFTLCDRKKSRYHPIMKEVFSTNDLVKMSFACHLLAENDIEYFLFDTGISAVEGSIGAFPRRLMVENSDFSHAKRVLSNASLTI